MFLVKGNQPQLFEDLRVLFAPIPAPKRAGEGVLRLPEQHAQTTEKAHGRMDIRSIRVSSELQAGFSTIAARMRYNSTHPQAALEVLSLSL